MTDSELEHLRKMANQIAANFSFHDDQVERITDHLTRFWAPSLRRLLTDYALGGGQGVEKAVRLALTQMQDSQSAGT